MKYSIKHLIGYSLVGVFSVATILPILAIILHILVKGVESLSLDFLFTTSQIPGQEGIFAPIAGTVILTMLTMMLAIPFGILSAIFMAEYVKRGKLLRFVEVVIANLAGIPSIVYGLFGLGLFVYFL